MTLPILTTARLTMVPYSEDDIDALHALWTDPDVRHLWDDVVISRNRAAEVVRDSIATAQSHGIGYWTLRTQAGGPIIGEGGFRFIDGHEAIELMYCLARSHWGRGLAFEASQAALAYAWTSTLYELVYARIDAPNEASLRLVRRLGFQYVSSSDGLDTYVVARASWPARTAGGPSHSRMVSGYRPPACTRRALARRLRGLSRSVNQAEQSTLEISGFRLPFSAPLR